MTVYRPSSPHLYLVRWSETKGKPNGKWDSRVFRLRRPAIEWLVLIETEGHAAELYVAPTPSKWRKVTAKGEEQDAVRGVVSRRLARRQAARDRWADA